MPIQALELFSSLSNEIRLRILVLLTGVDELCVCDLTDAMQLQQPQVSRHLGLLREAGLVSDRRAGQWVHYRINPALPAWALEVLRQARGGVRQTSPYSLDAQRLDRNGRNTGCNLNA